MAEIFYEYSENTIETIIQQYIVLEIKYLTETSRKKHYQPIKEIEVKQLMKS